MGKQSTKQEEIWDCWRNDMEFVTYSMESGFNIVDCEDEQSAEILTGPESVCLDSVEEFDEVIVKRIRELLS